jgi:hypothetical protein
MAHGKSRRELSGFQPSAPLIASLFFESAAEDAELRCFMDVVQGCQGSLLGPKPMIVNHGSGASHVVCTMSPCFSLQTLVLQWC